MAGSSRGWVEEALGLSGLSDMADIFGELMREQALSPSALGLSPSKAADLHSRLDQPLGGEGPRSARSEEERRELRIWMRRKQRERMVEYRRERDGKREMEHKPFSAPAAQKSTSNNLQAQKKTKAENDKRVFLEQYNQRAREACSLITDLLTTPLILPSSSSMTLTRPTSCSQQPLMVQPSGSVLSTRGRSLSVGVKKQGSRTQLGRARSLSSTRTVSQKRPASRESIACKLGLHRPVSALPRDRLSRVTRRGMLTDPKSKTRPDPANKELRRERSQTPPDKGSRGGADQWEMEERDVVSPWDPPPEIRRLLGMDDSDLGLGVPGALEGQVSATHAGASGLDWMENLSGSTSSILSKLDWAAIESMVAGE